MGLCGWCFHIFYKEIPSEYSHFQIYVHSPEEEPFHLSTVAQKPVKQSIRLFYGIEEIINAEDVNTIPPAKRGCRFLDEPISSNLQNYSFSNCINELLAIEEMKMCNCTTDARLLSQSRTCTLSDKDCLLNNKITDTIRERQSNDPSTCLPTCVEMQINDIGKDLKSIDHDIRVGIEILQLPYIRYRRRLSASIMDLVVCVGGIAGLFFGASVINIAESLYIWIIRRY